MKRFFIVAGAVVTLAVPSAAVAAPDYDNWALKDNTTYDQKNLVGRYSSRIKFDGIAVSGQENSIPGGTDNTTYPGSRADILHGVLAESGLGKH